VHDAVFDKFSQKLADAVRKFKVGEGVKDGITHGPLIHEAAVKKVQQHVDDAVSKGAKVVVGGKKLDVPGYFFEPTVLADVQSCAIDNEETFGPLAALYRFKTEEEAVEMANNTEVGLAGCVRASPRPASPSVHSHESPQLLLHREHCPPVPRRRRSRGRNGA
jgi:succinate-semialdehyde dehydrogenase/glutarate-semialdehyde dehydrogenase